MPIRFIFILLLSIYAFVGITFLKWNVFYFVYLYWFENVIHILMNALKNISTPHLIDAQGQPISQNMATGKVFGSIFVNFVYFVFIVVGIGFMYPLMVLEREAGKVFIFDMMTILVFRHTTFNIALLGCLAGKVLEYLQEFVFQKKYTAQNPLKTIEAFSPQDITLHLTILLGLGLAIWTKAEYAIGLIMIATRLGFELFRLKN